MKKFKTITALEPHLFLNYLNDMKRKGYVLTKESSLFYHFDKITDETPDGSYFLEPYSEKVEKLDLMKTKYQNANFISVSADIFALYYGSLSKEENAQTSSIIEKKSALIHQMRLNIIGNVLLTILLSVYYLFSYMRYLSPNIPVLAFSLVVIVGLIFSLTVSTQKNICMIKDFKAGHLTRPEELSLKKAAISFWINELIYVCSFFYAVGLIAYSTWILYF